MILKVFSIMDTQVSHYSQPFFAPTIGHALRSFAEHCKLPDNLPNRYPQDFALYLLGDFDDESGAFTQADKPTRIANATDHKEPAAPLDISDALKRAKKGA